MLGAHGKWLTVLTLLACCLGCSGGDSVERTSLSGKVTFQGKPVPSGLIYFTPDTSRGNSGPQGFAEIVDGKYCTNSKGLGAMAGPLSVQITGFSGKKAVDADGQKALLFPTYQTKVELTEGTKKLDFDIK